MEKNEEIGELVGGLFNLAMTGVQQLTPHYGVEEAKAQIAKHLRNIASLLEEPKG